MILFNFELACSVSSFRFPCIHKQGLNIYVAISCNCDLQGTVPFLSPPWSSLQKHCVVPLIIVGTASKGELKSKRGLVYINSVAG
jgi:hypothetical protein